ncbi:MAG: glycoside hydrolase family 31 protein [Lachnospiraceae bacterium]
MLKAILKVPTNIIKVERSDNRLILTSEAMHVFLSPKSETIVKVSFSKDDAYEEIYISGASELEVFTDWEYEEEEAFVSLKTKQLTVVVSKATAGISFYDTCGNLLMEEIDSRSKLLEPYQSFKSIESKNARQRIIDTPDGKKTVIDSADQVFDRMLYRSTMNFALQDGEKLFGLGQQEDGVFDLVGNTVYMYQKNMRIAIPFYQSTKGYGILIDSYAPFIFSSSTKKVQIKTEADVIGAYYFIKGQTFDETISGYRFLTGKATLLPKWAYGFIQSLERYESAEEMIQCVQRYREEEVGIDCIVLDWMSWIGELWGQKSFDPERFQNPKDMMKQLHDLHARLMVSIWPAMRNGGENQLEMKEKGQMLPNSDTYNAFVQSGRDLYWKQANEGLFQHDIDAWWCDSCEPITTEWAHLVEPADASAYSETFAQSKNIMQAELSNAYALYHAQGVFEGQRSVTTDKRVMNLSRSAYTGQQKYGCCMWSGDIAATWDVLKNQVVAGLQFCASGLPYWTFDIGAFFVKSGEKWFWHGKYDAGNKDLGYCELYTRWYQLGAFMPVFRSHGTDTNREIWNFKQDDNSMFYDAQKQANRLRYQLLPTIYSHAYKVWKYDTTMLRMLAFDFLEDTEAVSTATQFMFGKSLLVCPVLEAMYYDKESTPITDVAHQIDVYLPKGEKWVDYYTNTELDGGQHLTVETTMDHIPLYVRAGSILFTSKYYHHAEENVENEINIQIYPGKNVTEQLFLDDGDNYSFEAGNYCEIQFEWNDDERVLSIANPVGDWWNDTRKATFTVCVHGIEKKITYLGKAVEITI